eukprot:scaffold2183_cov19-Tisochrysis_lutea.AAC.3
MVQWAAGGCSPDGPRQRVSCLHELLGDCSPVGSGQRVSCLHELLGDCSPVVYRKRVSCCAAVFFGDVRVQKSSEVEQLHHDHARLGGEGLLRPVLVSESLVVTMGNATTCLMLSASRCTCKNTVMYSHQAVGPEGKQACTGLLDK